MWLGSRVSTFLCQPQVCTLGATRDVVFPAMTNLVGTIPCDAALIGGRFAVQAADIGGHGGCPAGSVLSVPLALSDVIETDIG